jgi:hypothetical protein
MKPMVSMASRRGVREMSAEDEPDAARRALGTVHPELPRAGFLAPARPRSRKSAGRGGVALMIALPAGHPAATSRDKRG